MLWMEGYSLYLVLEGIVEILPFSESSVEGVVREATESFYRHSVF